MYKITTRTKQACCYLHPCISPGNTQVLPIGNGHKKCWSPFQWMDLTSLVHEGTNTKTCQSALILRTARQVKILGRHIWGDSSKALKATSKFPMCDAGVCSVGHCMSGTPGTDVCCCTDQAPEEIAGDTVLCCSMVTHVVIAPSVWQWRNSYFLWSWWQRGISSSYKM